MPVRYENGKKVDIPYTKKGERYYKEGESKATTSLSQYKRTPTERMREMKDRNLKGMKDNYLRAVDLITTSGAAAKLAGKTLYSLTQSAKAKAVLSGLMPGIITSKGEKKWRKAQKEFEGGKGQPKVRQSIKDMKGILKKYPERFDEKKTGFSTDTLDEMAAHAVLNPKNKASGYRGKKYGKRFLAEAYEALKNKYKISKVDIHQTNRELKKTLEGTAGVRQQERTFDKAREGTFNPPHTSDLKRIWRKKKSEE